MDGLGRFGITNQNSIGIEGCQDTSTGPNVWHWDFHPKTYEQMILLTAHLMNKYNVPLSRVVRHYDASRKMCPGNWQHNNWAKWHKFKKDLEAYVTNKTLTSDKGAPPVISKTTPLGKGSQDTDMYTIKAGDTLSRIARDHNVTVDQLVEWNDLDNPNLIFPETKLKVKDPNQSKAGRFRFNTTVNVRNQPGAWGDSPAQYYRGEVVNFDDKVVKDGMTWLKYRSWDGRERYISAGTESEPYGEYI